uniref:Kinase n=2 Tax=Parascaris univalens TaxID=6257 RepID=A0A914ZPQ2_PARUN
MVSGNILSNCLSSDTALTMIKNCISSNAFSPYHESFMEVYLSPFRHQVGGHSIILCPDDIHICKPYIEREADFYKKMPSHIAQFTPAFCGEIQVNVDGRCASMLTIPTISPSIGRKPCSSCIDGEFPAYGHSSFTHHTSTRYIFRDTESGLLNEANPWSAKCRMRIPKEMQSSNGAVKNRYIVLENIVREFRYPCILDLKMGIRQHGDGIDELKRLRFVSKCERTTSKKYGVRVAGMQYYDASNSMYQCVNKYYGESLSFLQMRNFLYEFFGSPPGSDRQKLLFKSFHDKLIQLHKALSKAEGCRLFSASLLVVYDGDPQLVLANDTDKGRVEICLVDFAHSTCQGMDDEVKYSGPDDGILRGIRTLINIFVNAL